MKKNMLFKKKVKKCPKKEKGLVNIIILHVI